MALLLSTRSVAARIRGTPSARAAAKPQTRHLELSYQATIKAPLSAFHEYVLSEADKILDYIGTRTAPKFDDPSDVIERTFAGLRVVISTYFDKRTLSRIAVDAALKIDRTNRDQFRRMIKTIMKVDPLLSEPWLEERVNTFVKENVSLIKTIPAEGLDDIEQMLYRDAQRRLSPKEMRSKIIEQFGVSESRAELIATDQVLKFNASLTEARQTSLGVKRYIWRTSEDQRVRPLHDALNGKEFSWDKPPISGTKGERLPPGKPIRCRCYAEPVMDDLLK